MMAMCFYGLWDPFWHLILEENWNSLSDGGGPVAPGLWSYIASSKALCGNCSDCKTASWLEIYGVFKRLGVE
ncbi:hypothetical protein K1719_015076 [Acacia pycnantha]|nr:hypothetical protein K1719_015076 [Acacia pycnantha]